MNGSRELQKQLAAEGGVLESVMGRMGTAIGADAAAWEQWTRAASGALTLERQLASEGGAIESVERAIMSSVGATQEAWNEYANTLVRVRTLYGELVAGEQQSINVINAVTNATRLQGEALRNVQAAASARVGAALPAVVPDLSNTPALVNAFSRGLKEVGSIAGETGPRIQNIAQLINRVGSVAVLAQGPLGGFGSRFIAIGALVTTFGAVLGGVIIAVAGFAIALGKSVAAAAEFDRAMVNVEKTTNLTKEQIAALSAEFLTMSGNLGVPATELAGIAEVAGQIGVKGAADIALFTEEIAKLSRTTNLSVKDAAEQMGILLNTTASAPEMVRPLTNELTALGNTFAGGEAKILGLATEIARAGGAFGLSAQDALAFGAALSQMGVRAEGGGTAIGRLTAELAKLPTEGGRVMDEFAKVIGKSTEDAANLIRTDMGQALEEFIAGLGRAKAAGIDTLAILKDFGISGIREAKALEPLINNINVLTKARQTAAAESKNMAATDAELAKQNETLHRQWEFLKTDAVNFATAMGTVAEPAVKNFVKALDQWFFGTRPGIEGWLQIFGRVGEEINALAHLRLPPPPEPARPRTESGVPKAAEDAATALEKENEAYRKNAIAAGVSYQASVKYALALGALSEAPKKAALAIEELNKSLFETRLAIAQGFDTKFNLEDLAKARDLTKDLTDTQKKEIEVALQGATTTDALEKALAKYGLGLQSRTIEVSDFDRVLAGAFARQREAGEAFSALAAAQAGAAKGLAEIAIQTERLQSGQSALAPQVLAVAAALKVAAESGALTGEALRRAGEEAAKFQSDFEKIQIGTVINAATIGLRSIADHARLVGPSFDEAGARAQQFQQIIDGLANTSLSWADKMKIATETVGASYKDLVSKSITDQAVQGLRNIADQAQLIGPSFDTAGAKVKAFQKVVLDLRVIGVDTMTAMATATRIFGATLDELKVQSAMNQLAESMRQATEANKIFNSNVSATEQTVTLMKDKIDALSTAIRKLISDGFSASSTPIQKMKAELQGLQDTAALIGPALDEAKKKVEAARTATAAGGGGGGTAGVAEQSRNIKDATESALRNTEGISNLSGTAIKGLMDGSLVVDQAFKDATGQVRLMNAELAKTEAAAKAAAEPFLVRPPKSPGVSQTPLLPGQGIGKPTDVARVQGTGAGQVAGGVVPTTMMISTLVNMPSLETARKEIKDFTNAVGQANKVILGVSPETNWRESFDKEIKRGIDAAGKPTFTMQPQADKEGAKTMVDDIVKTIGPDGKLHFDMKPNIDPKTMGEQIDQTMKDLTQIPEDKQAKIPLQATVDDAAKQQENLISQLSKPTPKIPLSPEVDKDSMNAFFNQINDAAKNAKTKVLLDPETSATEFRSAIDKLFAATPLKVPVTLDPGEDVATKLADKFKDKPISIPITPLMDEKTIAALNESVVKLAADNPVQVPASIDAAKFVESITKSLTDITEKPKVPLDPDVEALTKTLKDLVLEKKVIAIDADLTLFWDAIAKIPDPVAKRTVQVEAQISSSPALPATEWVRSYFPKLMDELASHEPSFTVRARVDRPGEGPLPRVPVSARPSGGDQLGELKPLLEQLVAENRKQSGIQERSAKDGSARTAMARSNLGATVKTAEASTATAKSLGPGLGPTSLKKTERILRITSGKRGVTVTSR
jgi:TP901 family phage tail tape measure protein